jgi:hypothetical protein
MVENIEDRAEDRPQAQPQTQEGPPRQRRAVAARQAETGADTMKVLR